MLFLHIGLHKTGTTFLQQAVFPKWKGIHYIPEDKLEFLVRMDGAQDYLLSREGLSGKNWAHAEERAKNIACLAELFPLAKVLISFRKHSSFIVSSYKQYLQQGGYLAFEDYFDLNADRGFMKQEDFLFRNKMDLVDQLFEPSPFVMLYEDITKNLAYLLPALERYMGGTAPAVEDIKLGRRNKSVGYYPAKLLRYLNGKSFSKLNDQGKYDLYNWRLKRLGLDPRSICQYKLGFLPDRPILNAEQLKQIDNLYADDWAYIKERAASCGNAH
jgi:hypothetical protein